MHPPRSSSSFFLFFFFYVFCWMNLAAPTLHLHRPAEWPLLPPCGNLNLPVTNLNHLLHTEPLLLDTLSFYFWPADAVEWLFDTAIVAALAPFFAYCLEQVVKFRKSLSCLCKDTGQVLMKALFSKVLEGIIYNFKRIIPVSCFLFVPIINATPLFALFPVCCAHSAEWEI